jgi:hypothetical protein
MMGWSPDHEAQLYYAVLRVLLRYTRGMDRRDWDSIASAFHADARYVLRDDVLTVAEFIENMQESQTVDSASTHFLGSPNLLDVDHAGRAVLVETPCLAWQRSLDQDALHSGTGTGNMKLTGCRYLDVLEDRDGDFRIVRRTVVFDWVNAAPAPDSPPGGPTTLGSRTPADPSYQHLEAFRQRTRAPGDTSHEQ